jgi:hypothetical protein
MLLYQLRYFCRVRRGQIVAAAAYDMKTRVG